jgi:4-aminobutyrate aminotransferase-like enzyme
MDLCCWWQQEVALQLDDNLKHLMKELGAAINDALSESEEISEAIQNVRNAGYDVFLVHEATIGFNRRSKSETGDEGTANALKRGDMKLKVTTQDLKFLRSLKISVEDLDQNP